MTRRRGFTLIEAVVVASLIAGGTLVVTSLIITLNTSTTAEVERAEQSRQLALAEDQLIRDLGAARPCHPARIGPTVTHVDGTGNHATALAFTIDPATDGRIDHVVWQIDGGVLTRTIVPDDGSCTLPGDLAGAITSPLLPGVHLPTDGVAGLWLEQPAPTGGDDMDVCGADIDVDDCSPTVLRFRFDTAGSDGAITQIRRAYTTEKL